MIEAPLPPEAPDLAPALTAARMYRALVERDGAFDGRFVVGVKTTGIFCRPVCPARKPKAENVEFFATPKEAVHAGYRACRRCDPVRAGALDRPVPAWLSGLKDRIDADPLARPRDADLRAQGLDPSTVRRAFKARYGMTLHAYARAARMGRALAPVRAVSSKGSGGAGAMAARAGYASESGFRAAFARLFGGTPGSANAQPLIARWLDTPLGAMLALADDEGLRLLDFVDRRGLERHLERIRAAARGRVIAPGAHPHLDATALALDRYFRGDGRLATADSSPVPLVPLVPGSPFQRAAWEGLRRIPFGEVRSYAAQAAALGNPAAVRAVARANGENFIALFVPCHRVIGSDGSLTGYGGGLDRKRWLLDHERRHAGPPSGAEPTLFTRSAP